MINHHCSPPPFGRIMFATFFPSTSSPPMAVGCWFGARCTRCVGILRVGSEGSQSLSCSGTPEIDPKQPPAFTTNHHAFTKRPENPPQTRSFCKDKPEFAYNPLNRGRDFGPLDLTATVIYCRWVDSLVPWLGEWTDNFPCTKKEMDIKNVCFFCVCVNVYVENMNNGE